MSKKKRNDNDLPVLEINPSEEYHERPMWQRIAAVILIILIIIATGIIAIWPKITM